MVFYEGLVGSRSSNLEVSTSDYDYFVCSDLKSEFEKSSKLKTPYHIIYNTPSFFINQILFNLQSLFSLQLFFPKELLSETELTNYIINNREKILLSNSVKIHQSFFSFLAYLQAINKNSETYKKRFAYAYLCAELLINYIEKDVSFEELFVTSGSKNELLLSIREGIDLQLHEEEFYKNLYKISNLRPIYEQKQNPEYLKQVKSDLQEILHLTT